MVHFENIHNNTIHVFVQVRGNPRHRK
jgi:hypothetical protein